MVMALSHPAFAAESKALPVMKSAEALNALKDIIPEVKVLEVNATPVQGLFEVVVESRGKKGIIYLDSSQKYLISGSIVDIATKQNLTQERSAEINKVNVSEIPLDDALVMGDKSAPKKVVVFTDPD
jgi:thiol:disulfide interchange protein DsbC